VPVRREAVVTAVLAHRRDNNAITESDLTQGERRKRCAGAVSVAEDISRDSFKGVGWLYPVHSAKNQSRKSRRLAGSAPGRTSKAPTLPLPKGCAEVGRDTRRFPGFACGGDPHTEAMPPQPLHPAHRGQWHRGRMCICCRSAAVHRRGTASALPFFCTYGDGSAYVLKLCIADQRASVHFQCNIGRKL
jgi:hypothetical protein